MPQRPRVLYQVATQAPPGAFFGIESFESAWHQGWAEPVRQKITPALAIALAASGLFFTPAPPFDENIFADKWIYPWSEPVWPKRGLQASLQRDFTVDTNTFPAGVGMGWYAPLGEPKRLKLGLEAGLQRFTSLDFTVVPPPALSLQGWYNWFGEPVWPQKGLKSYLQQTIAYHPRLLPNPDVTMVMAATETNNDVALFGINVYNASGTVTSGEGARVSIIEVTPSGTGPTSIRES